DRDFSAGDRHRLLHREFGIDGDDFTVVQNQFGVGAVERDSPKRQRGDEYEANHEASGGIVADCARISSRASRRMPGKGRAKTPAPTPQATAPAATVAGAPMCSASTPAISAPIGAIPISIME